MEKPKYSAACEKTTCGLLTNLVIGVIDDIILEKLSRDLQSDKKASQVSPLLQFRKSLQQPVEDRVHHRFAACHKALSESAPARREGIHSMCIWTWLKDNMVCTIHTEYPYTYTSEWFPGGKYLSIPSRAHILFTVCSGISSLISMACWKARTAVDSGLNMMN